MRVRLNKKHLDDGFDGIFELHVNPSRVAYVPKDEGDTEIGERGLPEYILTYKSRIPGSTEEPELYGIPHEEDVKKITRLGEGQDVIDEIWLKYKDSTVILISEKEDDKFRAENKDLTERIEALYVESGLI